MTTTAQPKRLSSTREKRRKKLSAQYIAWWIHSLFGLKLTLALSLVLFTGAIAVLAEEIDWLVYPEMRVERQPGQVHLSPGQLADQVKLSHPELSIYYVQIYPDRPYLAAQIDFDRPDGSWGKLWINPYTGAINGELDYLTPGRFFADLHGDLFLGRPGRILVNFTGILVLMALITGLIAYPKFWRYFLFKPRTGNLRVFLGDLHKLVGLWSLWIVLCIGLSGSWWFYHFPLAFYMDMPELVEPRKSKPLLDYDQIPEQANFMSITELVESTEKTFPGMQINIARPPEHNSDVYTLIGTADEWLLTAWRGNKVFVSPYTGEVIDTDMAADRTIGQRFDGAMGPLHYGNWGTGSGYLPVRFAWFLGGLAMTFLSISGMLIYYKRARKATKKLKQYHWFAQRIPALQSEKSQNAWRILRPFGGPMSGFKYLNILVLVGMCIGFVQFLMFQTAGVFAVPNVHRYPAQSLGPWQISAHIMPGLPGQAPVRAGENTSLNVNIPIDALEQIKFIYARVGKPRTLRAPGSIIHGGVSSKHVHLPVPARANQSSKLWLTAETWDGEFYQTSWPLFPTEKE